MRGHRRDDTEALMTEHDHSSAPSPAGGGPPPGVDPAEWQRLTEGLESRFAPHVEAAAAEVRSAEQHLAQARADLDRAREESAGRRYRSDRLVFMRASVGEELEGLERKTTPKKLRVAYRYLLARAAELAEGEVAGYRADQEAVERDREHSVEARAEAERQAATRLEAARQMQDRVRQAQEAARRGMAVLAEKLGDDGERASA